MHDTCGFMSSLPQCKGVFEQSASFVAAAAVWREGYFGVLCHEEGLLACLCVSIRGCGFVSRNPASTPSETHSFSPFCFMQGVNSQHVGSGSVLCHVYSCDDLAVIHRCVRRVRQLHGQSCKSLMCASSMYRIYMTVVFSVVDSVRTICSNPQYRCSAAESGVAPVLGGESADRQLLAVTVELPATRPWGLPCHLQQT
eukprot:3982728-Amphidinium_carterae.1